MANFKTDQTKAVYVAKTFNTGVPTTTPGDVGLAAVPTTTNTAEDLFYFYAVNGKGELTVSDKIKPKWVTYASHKTAGSLLRKPNTWTIDDVSTADFPLDATNLSTGTGLVAGDPEVGKEVIVGIRILDYAIGGIDNRFTYVYSTTLVIGDTLATVFTRLATQING